MAISELKNGKATGHYQITAKLIEEGGKELKKVIYELEEITEYQQGFQSRKSTVDQTFYYDTNIGKMWGTQKRGTSSIY